MSLGTEKTLGVQKMTEKGRRSCSMHDSVLFINFLFRPRLSPDIFHRLGIWINQSPAQIILGSDLSRNQFCICCYFQCTIFESKSIHLFIPHVSICWSGYKHIDLVRQKTFLLEIYHRVCNFFILNFL